MKKNMAIIVLIVVGFLIVNLMINYGNIILSGVEDDIVGNDDNSIETNFDDYTSNVSINNTVMPSIMKKSYDLSLVNNYQIAKVENLLNNNINTKYDSSNINKELMYSLVEGKIKNNQKYSINYNQINDNKYVVSVSYADGTFDNYLYNKSKSLFGKDKFSIISFFSGDISLNDNLIDSEYSRTFNYNIGYQNSYIEDLGQVIEDSDINDIYNYNKDKVYIFNVYSGDTLIDSGSGFLISSGVAVTSWNFISDAIKNGTSIECMDSNFNKENIFGIISINKDSDIALLKISDNKAGVLTGNINPGDQVLLVGSQTGFGTTGKIGVNIVNDNKQVNALNVSKINIGGPLFNKKGEVVGMALGDILNNDISNSVSINYINEYLGKVNCNKYTSIEYLFNKYYTYDEKVEKEIVLPNDIYEKYTDIDFDINASLVEYHDSNNVLSLRYLNDSEIDSNVIISSFMSALQSSNFEEVLNSSKKKIYRNQKYDINIYMELSYIIVVIMEK